MQVPVQDCSSDDVPHQFKAAAVAYVVMYWIGDVFFHLLTYLQGHSGFIRILLIYLQI